MKNLFFGIMALATLAACDNTSESFEEKEITPENITQNGICLSEVMREELLKKNPEARARAANIEVNLSRFIADRKAGKVLEDGTVEIPVVVNVIYNTSAENVSRTRIDEQIAVLNEDFSGTNADISKVPKEFADSKAGNAKIKFRLVKVVRKKTASTGWYPNDAMKLNDYGGINATDPSKYLNIWVVGVMPYKTGYVLGYAAFPESAGFWNDGVVISYFCFGKTGANRNYNKGRVGTHEVGHYLNLRHIWGDDYCGNDLVADTPVQEREYTGNPAYPQYSLCGNVKRSVMFMNYMDYV